MCVINVTDYLDKKKTLTCLELVEQLVKRV